jgi:small subunit ribosomal protein S6
MQHYELCFIGSIRLTEEEQKKLVEKISTLAGPLGMAITSTKDMGKRKLAYPIKKETQGYYFLVELDSEQAQIKKLDHELRLLNDIIRFVILKKRVKTAEEIDHEMKIREKIEGRKREAERIELAKEQEKKQEETKQEEAKKTDDSKKISLEDLDKKLDDILKEEDV